MLRKLLQLLGLAPKPAPVPPPITIPSTPELPNLIYDENFETVPAWTVRTGRWGGGNGELQYYTDKNHRTEDGQLVIRAKHEPAPDGGIPCTSTRLASIDAVKFTPPVRITARIYQSKADGVWGAFWMRGLDKGDDTWPNKGEIDIMELPQYLAAIPGRQVRQAALHGPSRGNPSADAKTDGLGSAVTPALTDSWHEWGIDWYPDRIEWHIDGKKFASVTKADYESKFGGTWVFDGRFPFYLILNLAVGGWAGDPNTSQFPAYMKVDWIRAWRL